MKFPVLKLAGLAGSLVAILVTMGLHWDLLQALAWTRMLAQYSRTEPLSQAVGMTFDGQHPCPLCLKIRSGRQQQERNEQQSPSPKTEVRGELFFEPSRVTAPIPALVASDLVPFVPAAMRILTYRPPKPPPRSCVA
jgi:hypothetical protein